MRILSKIAAVGLFVGIAVQAASWYVDNSLSSSLNTGASWANAWTNLASVTWKYYWMTNAGVNAGDTLYISGGSTSQTYAAPFQMSGNIGTATDSITIQCGTELGHNGLVIIDGGGLTNCIEWNGLKRIFITGQIGGDKQRHIRLINAGNANTNSYVSQGSAIKGTVLNSTVEFVEVTNCWNGIEMQLGNGDEVSNCKLTGIIGDRALKVGNSNFLVSTNFVHDCEIGLVRTSWSSGGGADGIQTAGSITISNCFIYGMVGPLTFQQHQDGVQHNGSNVRVDRCVFLNIGNSACESTGDTDSNAGATNITFINNLVWWSRSDILTDFTRGFEWIPHTGMSAFTDYYIANNTFVDVPRWAAISFADNVTTNIDVLRVIIINNLIYNCGLNTMAAIQLQPFSGMDTNTFTVDYNLVVAGPTATSNGNILINGSTWVQAHPRSVTPTFTSYSTFDPSNNFRLSPLDTSSRGLAINQNSVFGYDLDARPRGSLWDVGAYQSGMVLGTGTLRSGVLKSR